MSTRSLDNIVEHFARAGKRIEVHVPGQPPLSSGAPSRAVVRFHSLELVGALLRGDHLALAEGYLRGDVDVEGDFTEILAVTALLDLEISWGERARFLWSRFGPGQDLRRSSDVADHYDRPAAFFLPWLDRWRSYSHGFYLDGSEDLEAAQERKLDFAFDKLGLEPGQRVLDMGAGWGGFMEFAGLRGVHVHGITVSHAQRTFVQTQIDEGKIPATVELVDFFHHRPQSPYDAVVFMGTLEHLPDYRRVARWLHRHIAPGGRIYADFCAQRRSFLFGRFMRRYVWPGVTTYVDPAGLLRAFLEADITPELLVNDTACYERTCRDWADRLEVARGPLASRFGESDVRAFTLYLRASQHFFATNQSQAYHLLATRGE